MTDWQEWHEQYDVPDSSLSRRLAVVRTELGRVLAERAGRPTRLLSLCSGDGRDTLPVLADGHLDVEAVLVELDPTLTEAARLETSRLELSRVQVLTGDAGDPRTFDDVGPVDVLMLCGIFGNITDADVRGTVARIPELVATGAHVIWTRGRRTNWPDPSEFPGDPSEMVCEAFARAGLVEESFVRPDDAGFRVGVHRYDGAPMARVERGRLFTFVH